jgi:metallo-beta-lactamase class B
LISGLAGAAAPFPPKTCDACEAWNRPQKPFRIHGNTWYVGTAGLSSVLIHSPQGAILIDGGLPQSAPLIAANIRELGFKLEDIRIIVNSHAHYDHAGGIAELQLGSGARVYASPASKLAFEAGGPVSEDPQFTFGKEHNSFPVIREVTAVKDGETLRIGELAITAHFTPGHTPGGTSWTWRDCEAGDCKSLVYADSLNSVSAPGFKFTGDGTYPSRVDSFRHSIDVVAGLDCDILVAPHPEQVDLAGKLERLQASPAQNPWLDASACKTYAAAARQRLEQRVLEESGTR